MFLKLFLAFTIIPFVELYLLIKIGGYLGAFTTILVVLLTGFLGAYLAKLQGIKTMTRIRSILNQGGLPAQEMIDAMLIFIAGAVLLTPGFLTDIAGIIILIPTTRLYIKRWLRYKFGQWIKQNRIVPY
ncbi:MAG: FxsA family protein [Thermodesulfobacteriota bacterium]|nr:FxsA family protein [Thermodesulfobacteriota bacterium]